jgi:heptaprenyl diphosphate synthase
MKLKILYSFLQSDLDKIEDELESTIQSKHPVLKDASLQLLQAGGKRIRPVFVLLAGKFGDYDINVMKKVAVTLELIHMASLVHDDVIDDAELRRGKPTIKSKWDNRVAMYTGDYILARSLELMTEINQAEAHEILANTIVEVCVGEIEQIRDKFDWDQNVRTYFRRIKRKTALLIAASCQLGAVCSNVPRDVHKKLFLFGYYVGMAFQITDDILDFTGTEKELGKPAGSDLLQGNITLPVLYAIRDAQVKRELVDYFENPRVDDYKRILNLIVHSGGIEYAQKVSDSYLQKAFAVLAELPQNRAKTAFSNIAKFIGKRNF